MITKANKKRAFTLMELMLVLCLCSLAFGSMMGISKALFSESFEKSQELLLSKIQLAAECTYDTHIDVSLIIEQSDGKIAVSIVPEKQLPLPAMRALNRYTELKGIEKIHFNGRYFPTLELKFDSSIGALPKGKLELFQKEKSSVLFLRGFLGEIMKNTQENEEAEETTPYPEEAFSIT